MDRTAAAERLKTFEGSTDYMYLCTGGDVTIGVGHALSSSAKAVSLPWIAGPLPATIASAFARVAAAEKGLSALRYQSLTQCRLSAASIDVLLLADIAAFEAGLSAGVPGWQVYPEPAQQALFDMAYNLGVGGLMKFKLLLKACAAADWQTAVIECRRDGVAEMRNRETAALFHLASAK